MELLGKYAAHIVASGGRKGSGYLIAPRLVLTALHVVLDDVRVDQIPADVRCKLRLNGDVVAVDGKAGQDGREWRVRRRMEIWRAHAPPGECWLPATLLWPLAGDSPGNHDLALLQIDPGAESETADTDSHAGPAGKIHRNREFSECVGYPRFRKRDMAEGNFYEVELVDAESSGLDSRGEPVDSRAVARRLKVTSATPGQSDDWGGLSGAAIICRNELVGVAHDRVGGTHANNVIGYYPLSKVEAESSFWAYSGLEWQDSDTSRASASFDLGHHMANLDRSSESIQFTGFFNAAIPIPDRDRPGPARMVLLPGHAFDELSHCAVRLAEILAKGFPGAGNAYAEVPVLNLGQATTPVDVRIEAVFNDWANKLGSNRDDLANLSREKLQDRVRTWLAAADKPRLALLQHNDPHLSKGCREVIVAIREFLTTLPQAHPPCLLFLLVLDGVQCEETAGIYDKVKWPGKMEQLDAILKDELADILATSRLFKMTSPSDLTSGDIETWLGELAAQRWKPTEHSQQRLDDAFPDYLFVPMLSAKKKLEAELQMERI